MNATELFRELLEGLVKEFESAGTGEEMPPVVAKDKVLCGLIGDAKEVAEKLNHLRRKWRETLERAGFKVLMGGTPDERDIRSDMLSMVYEKLFWMFLRQQVANGFSYRGMGYRAGGFIVVPPPLEEADGGDPNCPVHETTAK